MKADGRTSLAIQDWLERFGNSVTSKDLEGALSLFVPDSDTLLLGYEAGEMAFGTAQLKAFVKRIFARQETFSKGTTTPTE